MVNRYKARVELFRKIFDHLNKDPPTYTDKDGNTKTYTILSSFPEVTPTFPCIVINPLELSVIQLGLSERPSTTTPGSFEIEFFAKTRDGKNAIDVARDKIQMIITQNWITEEHTIDTSQGGATITIQGVE